MEGFEIAVIVIVLVIICVLGWIAYKLNVNLPGTNFGLREHITGKKNANAPVVVVPPGKTTGNVAGTDGTPGQIFKRR